jgi:hypothetical protein
MRKIAGSGSEYRIRIRRIRIHTKCHGSGTLLKIVSVKKTEKYILGKLGSGRFSKEIPV